MVDPTGPGDPVWLNSDGSEVTDTEEVAFGGQGFAFGGLGRRRWIFVGLIVLIVAVVVVVNATHHAVHPAAARTPVAATSPAEAFRASNAAPDSQVPPPVQTTSYAPGRTPVSAVLIDDGAGSGSSSPNGTFLWAEELRNVSPKSLTLVGGVEARVLSTMPARVLAAGVTTDLTNMSAVPPSLTVIKPNQTVAVWISVQVDCSRIEANGLQTVGPIVASVRLAGFIGPGEYTINDQVLGGQFLRSACD